MLLQAARRCLIILWASDLFLGLEQWYISTLIPVVEVKITFVGLIQRLVGRREEAVLVPEETTLGGLIEKLVARYGQELEERLLENGDLAAHAAVLINGRNAMTQGGLQAKLSDGSESQVEIVVLGPPLMGG